VVQLNHNPGPDFTRLLGRRLRSWRRFRGLTPTQLAANVGLPAESLRQFEEGLEELASPQLFALLDELDVNLHDLITAAPDQRGRIRPIATLPPPIRRTNSDWMLD